MSSNIHLRGLNGIRAIAALAVVFSHISLSLKLFGFKKSFTNDLAAFGVTIFFALSGFLITYLLIREKEKFGDIKIKAFYLRRILRIWPLYFFYLLIVVVVLFFCMPETLPGSIAYYIFLGANVPFIFNFSLALLGHYWSLGVEEQFYLFWPWIVKRSEKLLRFLLIFVAVFALLKIGMRLLDKQTGIQWPYLVLDVTRFDCMAIGAIAAVFYSRNEVYFFKVCFNKIVQTIAWLSLIFMAFNRFHIASVIDNEIVACIAVVLIVNVCANAGTIIDLEKPVFNFLGKISYGIYVYHPLVIFLTARTMQHFLKDTDDVLKSIFIYAFIPLFTIGIAYLSFTFLEKRFLSLKYSFSPVKSSM
ncbi:MAG: acyltransferase [Bacteroidetes bacterium]|nr:MAG: acyltransferase [Bacteroidota bacterium]